MYTDQMKRAFHSVDRPKKGSVTIAEHTHEGSLLFLEVIVSESEIMSLGWEDQKALISYAFRVRDALVSEGAVVQISRGS
jgi:hypothetical protein